ncbi:hypothetical protein MG293_006268, partial [Ovis ammon polii]
VPQIPGGWSHQKVALVPASCLQLITCVALNRLLCLRLPDYKTHNSLFPSLYTQVIIEKLEDHPAKFIGIGNQPEVHKQTFDCLPFVAYGQLSESPLLNYLSIYITLRIFGFPT